MSSAAWILAVVHGTAASRSRPQGAGARNKARVRSCAGATAVLVAGEPGGVEAAELVGLLLDTAPSVWLP